MDNILKKIKGTFRQFKTNREFKLENIAVLYYVPQDSPKASSWHDGFTRAIEILSDDYCISMINLAQEQPTQRDLNSYDFILIKSNWNWIPDNYLRKKIKKTTARTGLMISGINPPPSIREMLFYDVLYYETFWYYPQIKDHPRAIHAFGIDTSIMRHDNSNQKIYDWITIGAFTSYKRHDLFLKRKGKKVAIGEMHYKDSQEIISSLEANDVEVIPFINYKELKKYLLQSKRLYIPASLHGGGERAVLEARACGIEVEIEKDNPKLEELTKSPIWNERYYANQLKIGFHNENEIKKNPYATLIQSSKRIMVDKESYHNGNFKIKGDEFVQIGAYCAIGENVKIITSNHDYNYPAIQGWFYNTHFDIRHPGEVKTPPNKERTKGHVTIGNDVWIGDNVIILSGVTIGDGCCIASGSVVNKDIQDYSIAAGVPAKQLKKRYNDNTIDIMKKLKWWNWSHNKIARNKSFFEADLNKNPFPNILE